MAWFPAAWTRGILQPGQLWDEGWAAEHTCPAVKALTYGLSSGSSGTMLILGSHLGIFELSLEVNLGTDKALC